MFQTLSPRSEYEKLQRTSPIDPYVCVTRPPPSLVAIIIPTLYVPRSFSRSFSQALPSHRARHGHSLCGIPRHQAFRIARQPGMNHQGPGLLPIRTGPAVATPSAEAPSMAPPGVGERMTWKKTKQGNDPHRALLSTETRIKQRSQGLKWGPQVPGTRDNAQMLTQTRDAFRPSASDEIGTMTQTRPGDPFPVDRRQDNKGTP